MQNTKPIIIAIDGTAASGKGTLAKSLANLLKFDYLDTGALYRSVAFAAIQNSIDLSNQDLVTEIAALGIDAALLLDPRIRDDDISNAASLIASYPKVREALLAAQRNFPKDKIGVVVEGRDIGTVIFPNADFKFYVTALPEIRAGRRYNELLNKGYIVDKAKIYQELQDRDDRDTLRQSAPLKIADDAIFIDNSDLNAKETLDEVLKHLPNNLFFREKEF